MKSPAQPPSPARPSDFAPPPAELMADARQSHFDTLYREQGDPWQVRSQWYEQRKRDLLLAMLPRARYRNAFEPGCGIGELSAELATRSDRVLISDFSPSARATCRERLADYPNVTVADHELPHDWPREHGPFDLIVFSELLYYFDDADARHVHQQCLASLAPDGHVVACHWRQPFDDRQQTSESVHALFDEAPLRRLSRYEEADLLIETWARNYADPASEVPR
ncbi:class I SAM-dependent methyltransferase [Uliginosibacterium sp. H1]|uniref:class I SAM-dependent methyltransferase n=1 Tax=Uliginosibacterium sp. H1 TaxID=3114757 RepID=UPI002E178ECA|nr:class I SAM-dependent methyltransferase [Uliginosibacterium sp. H1]